MADTATEILQGAITPAEDDYQAFKASRVVTPAVEAVTPVQETEAAGKENTEPVAKESETGDGSDKKKGGWQRKIERLERENQELAQKLAGKPAEAQQQQPAKPEAKAIEGKPVAPRIGDFDSYDKYADAHAEYLETLQDWKLDQRDAQRRQQETQERARQEQQTQLNTWNQRLAATKARIADFDEVIANATADHDIRISDAMRQSILTSEGGPDVVYYLAKNLAEAERIAKLDPISAARELGKIEAKVATGSAPAVKAEKRVSSAPPPVKPVGGTAVTARTLDDAGDDYQKYKADRLKGRK